MTRYKLVTPSGRTRHWMLVDYPKADVVFHGPNDFTSDGGIRRESAAQMLWAWRRLVRKNPRRYSIERRAS